MIAAIDGHDGDAIGAGAYGHSGGERDLSGGPGGGRRPLGGPVVALVVGPVDVGDGGDGTGHASNGNGGGGSNGVDGRIEDADCRLRGEAGGKGQCNDYEKSGW